MLPALTVKLLLPILAAAFLYQCAKYYWTRTRVITKENLKDAYDYVIIGGGTAGCIVAARLSELQNATILVLEAGHDDLDFPLTQWITLEQQLQLTDFDWKYETVPQEKCCEGYVNKRIKWPRGKGLGGCSSHNGGAIVRGSRYNYDRWDQELGPGSGWSYDDVLPYFKKFESMTMEKLRGRTETRGHDGPVVISEGAESQLADALIEAAERLGYPRTEDTAVMEGKDDQEGYGKFNRNQRYGRRLGTAEAYLRPALSRGSNNLHVLTHAHVTKILFDVSTPSPTATGVEFIHQGIKMTVHSSKEVILSAGSVNSPQLLMLSGIGPKEELEKHNIPVLVANDAVGRNMYDHPMVPVSATVNDTSLHFYGVDQDNWLEFTWAKMQFHLFGSGPLTDSGIRHTGFVRSRLTNDPWPDLQHFIVTSSVFSPYHIFNVNEKGAEALYPVKEEEDPARARAGMITILLQPHNQGEIRLRSADPFDHPIIDPKYLYDDLDVDVLARGLNISVQMITSPELRKYDMKLAGGHCPGCEHLTLWSDEYLKCYVRSMMTTVYHPIGTCRMGRKGENSVVDHKLKVHDVDRLRIIDASVFPLQVSANTNGPTMMVAEKGSDMIKDDFNR